MVEEGYDLKCKVPKIFSQTRFANYAVTAGHFVRRSENIKNYAVSKSVDSFRKQEPKNKLMI